jgi:hypothetical protein
MCECGILRKAERFDYFLKGFYHEGIQTNRGFDLWLDMIENYSRLQLTFENDRLPALAGLASYYSSSPGDYLAGIWRTDLVRSLMWARRAQSWHYDVHPRTARTSSGTPTWSWASIRPSEGEISEGVEFVYKGQCVILPDTRLNILDAHCVPTGSSPFGNVAEGFIRLEGAILRAEVIHGLCQEENCHSDQHYLLYPPDGSYTRHEWPFVVDVSCTNPLKKISRDESVVTLILGSCYISSMIQPGERDFLKFTLVLRSKGEDRYERIGLAIIEGEELFKRATVDTITLI